MSERAGTLVRLALPFVIGLVIALVIAAACFGLQSIIPRPSRGEQFAARVVSRLEQVRATRTVETFRPRRRITTICTARRGSDRLRLSSGLRSTIVGTMVRVARGTWAEPRYLAAEADLAACPHLLVKELVGRLVRGTPIRFRSARYDGVPVYVLRLDNRPPTVHLVLQRCTLAPVAIRFQSRQINGFSRIISAKIEQQRVRPTLPGGSSCTHTSS